MSEQRLIDANAIPAFVNEDGDDIAYMYDIRELPTINAVPVVRCGECVYNYGISNNCEFNPEDIVCVYWDTDGMQSGDYCSYGARMGVEDKP